MSNQDQFTAGSAPEANPPRRKRRLWRRILWVVLGVVVVLGALVALAPTLASTGPGKRLVVGQINHRILGRIALADLNLSWFGGTSVGGVELFDPQGRQVAYSAHVSLGAGLWRLMTSHADLGTIIVERPQVVLYADRQEHYSIQDVFTPPQEEAAKEQLKKEVRQARQGEQWKLPRFALHIRGGEIRVVRADGKEVAIRNLQVEQTFDRLDRLAGQISAELAGGTVSLINDVRDLTEQGLPSLQRAQGQVRLATTSLQMSELAAFGPSHWSRTAGRVAFTAETRVQSGALSITFLLDTDRLQMARSADEDLTPLSATVRGTAQLDPSSLTADVRLAGKPGSAVDPGALALNLWADRTSLGDMPSGSELARALVTAENVTLPRLRLTAQGQLHLPALARSVPALLALREGLTLQQGELVLDTVVNTTIATPVAQGTLTLTDVRGLHKGQPVEPGPVEIRYNLSLPAGKPMEIRQVTLRSQPVLLEGSGSADGIKANLRADLDLLQQRLAQLTELPSMNLAGQVDANVSLAHTNSQQIDLIATAQMRNIRVAGESRPPGGPAPARSYVQLDQGTLQLTSTLRLDQRRRLERIDVARLELNTPRYQVRGNGQYDTGRHALPQFAATVTGDLEELIRVARMGETPGAAAQGGGRPAIQGQMTWTLTGQVDRQIVLRGQAQAPQLVIGQGERAFELAQGVLDHDIVIDPQAKVITFRTLTIRSNVVNGSMAGTISRYDTARLLNLQGRLNGQGDQVTRLVEQFSPSMAGNFALAGPAVEFALSGTLTSPTAQVRPQATYAGLDGRGGVNADRAYLYGIDMTRIGVGFDLQDGVVTLQQQSVAANGGRVNVGGQIDLNARPPGGAIQGTSLTPERTVPVYRMPGRLQVLDGLQINERMSSYVVSRINPIFFGVQRISGSVSLVVEDVNVPLSSDILRTGYIRHGRLDFKDLRMQPPPFLAGILAVLGAPSQLLGGLGEIRIPGVDFRLVDGRVYYDDLRLEVAGLYHLRFRGYVGLNDELQLWLGLPATPDAIGNLARMLNLPNLPKFSVNILPFMGLKDNYLEVEIVGTRTGPQVKWDALVTSLVPNFRNAVEHLAGTGLDIGRELGQDTLDALRDPSKIRIRSPELPGLPRLELPRLPSWPGLGPQPHPQEPSRP